MMTIITSDSQRIKMWENTVNTISMLFNIQLSNWHNSEQDNKIEEKKTQKMV